MEVIFRKLNYALTILLFCTVTSTNLTAQVTIGSGIRPIKGALLDLKEHDADINNITSTKGIMLPRVHLSTRNSLWDIEGKPKDVKSYTGMLVYNTSKRDNFSPGVYMWDGEKWFALIEDEDEEDKDHTEWDPQTGILKDHEGNRYFTGDFGDAGIWTLQNLRTRSFPNKGGEIVHTDPKHENSDTEPQYGFPGKWTPENEGTAPPFLREYGLLYNFSAASFNKDTPAATAAPGESGEKHAQVQGLCPNGWHLPSDGEWTQLENEMLKNTTKYSDNPSDIGGNIPYGGMGGSLGTHGPAMLAKINMDDGGGNHLPVEGLSYPVEKKGFWVIPVGYAFTHTDTNFGLEGYFWTSSLFNSEAGWIRKFSANSQVKAVEKWYGIYPTLYSIRCKKDDSGKPY